jgi:hypothetical protein
MNLLFAAQGAFLKHLAGSNNMEEPPNRDAFEFIIRHDRAPAHL